MIHPSDFTVRSGDEIEFNCPVCSFDLTSPRSERFAELSFAQGEDQGRVIISKVIGEQATFLIMPQRKESFGKDVEGYSAVNIFGEGVKD